jgi:hypothetical protein
MLRVWRLPSKAPPVAVEPPALVVPPDAAIPPAPAVPPPALVPEPPPLAEPPRPVLPPDSAIGCHRWPRPSCHLWPICLRSRSSRPCLTPRPLRAFRRNPQPRLTQRNRPGQSRHPRQPTPSLPQGPEHLPRHRPQHWYRRNCNWRCPAEAWPSRFPRPSPPIRGDRRRRTGSGGVRACSLLPWCCSANERKGGATARNRVYKSASRSGQRDALMAIADDAYRAHRAFTTAKTASARTSAATGSATRHQPRTTSIPDTPP